MLTILKGKIQRARVTGLNLDYEGSITVDKDLLAAAGILPYEQVHVLNLNSGARFTTYAIEGESGSGCICLNGASARLAVKGDIVIILTYCHMEEDEAQEYTPRMVYVDADNRIVRTANKVETVPAWEG
jgi:aspartate 1-decarboxylase